MIYRVTLIWPSEVGLVIRRSTLHGKINGISAIIRGLRSTVDWYNFGKRNEFVLGERIRAARCSAGG